tara:strand:+ start:424 stop:657 length:234 start_codon:yes stop_codon:yes gene_type:complete
VKVFPTTQLKVWESMTENEAIEWAIRVLNGRRREWEWTDRSGLDKNQLETELHFDGKDKAAIKALHALKDLTEGGEA